MFDTFSFLISIGQCLILLVSFWGFGHLVSDLWRLIKSDTLNAPQLVVGFSAFVLLGGYLAAIKLASLISLLILLCVGVLRATFALNGYKAFERGKKTGFVITGFFWFALPFLCLLLFECQLLYRPMFHGHDDYQSYLVAIQRLLQQGWFGEDPFSLRLLVSALGGHSFFMAYAFVLADEEILYLLECIVGISCFLNVMHWHLRKKEKSLNLIWLGLILYICFLQNIVNVTSTVTVAPLLYAYIALRPTSFSSKDQVLQCRLLQILIVAALICLKTTNLPCVFVLVFWDFCRDDRGLVQRAYRWCMGGVGVFILVLGWLLAHQQATGAAFYPFIGQGHLCFQFPTFLFEGSGTFLERLGAIAKWIFMYPLLQLSLATIALLLLSKAPLKRNVPFIAVLTLPFLAGFMVLAKTGVYDFGHFDNLLRYIAPLCQAVLVFVFLDKLNLSSFSWSGKIHWSRVLVGFLILSYPMTTNLIQRYRVTERYFYMKKERVTNNALHSPTIALNDIRNAQNATPPGATIYVKASRPNLFDFKRNRIFVADYPNQMSPTQCLDKLPVPESEFVEHLRQNGIDYVIYNFKNEGGYPKATFQYMLSHQWAYYRRTARMTFLWSDQLKDLMEIQPQIFNNGAQVVIDLNSNTLE